jgi:hypothetical protein
MAAGWYARTRMTRPVSDGSRIVDLDDVSILHAGLNADDIIPVRKERTLNRLFSSSVSSDLNQTAVKT